LIRLNNATRVYRALIDYLQNLWGNRLESNPFIRWNRKNSIKEKWQTSDDESNNCQDESTSQYKEHVFF